ncbi:Sodium/potassium-transporting ATPase subunit beta-1 [Fasciolopsis buskii]|uniref:Sodium/potassium-transporting ATPase subunit beta-1 n=1 Tax=Fasciolopsis buskii TaxID=27845 RepID=A0A8E0VN02_9TREM|nr:Sodium/potassium-transporting ATPase subunit beta-1 [Fasciolopsis buski]
MGRAKFGAARQFDRLIPVKPLSLTELIRRHPFEERDLEILNTRKNLKSICSRMLYTLCIYLFVIAFFAAYMKLLFYFDIMDDYPKIRGLESPLSLNPGVSVVPTPSDRTSLVHVRITNPVSYNSLVDEMTAYLTHYQYHFTGGMYANCEDLRNYLNPRRSCRYNLDASGPCNLKSGYGYFRGQPCFAVKLNRIYGWLPSPVANATGVKVKCEGVTQMDSERLGRVCYYDMDLLKSYGSGQTDDEWCRRDFGIFSSIFYPYINQGNYQSPLVFVQFRNPKRYVIIWIKCYAIAKNIIVDVNKNQGSIVFQLLVE